MADADTHPDLFTDHHLGSLTLPNRIVMAPMTRSRAIGGVPNDLMAEYYRQRAGAGLIITEGTAPDPNGLGYARIPGLYSNAQLDGWRKVTEAVHEANGRIAVQLMHTGRIAHPRNLPAGARTLAPSAVQANGNMYTDEEGPQPHPTPEAMHRDEVVAARDGFVRAAVDARRVGFDAVELHGANGYLIEQFLSPHSNRREDDYGGSVMGRLRFAVEIAERAAAEIGAQRLGVRISPFNTFNDMRAYDETEATYLALVEKLSSIGLGFLHVVLTPDDRARAFAQRLRSQFVGTFILNGGFDRAKGDAAIATGEADLISFARSFIANPDLVERMRSGETLAEADASKFYTPGPEGYVDYSPVSTSSV